MSPWRPLGWTRRPPPYRCGALAPSPERAQPGALCFNVLNGGVHAPNTFDFQESMITPLGAASVAEAVSAGSEVYAALKKRLAARGS